MYEKLRKSNAGFCVAVFAALVAMLLTPTFTYAALCPDGVTDVADPATQCPGGPSSSGAQLSRDGAFECNSAQYANVGATAAIGGVYVPVNDAAVTLNTGYLIYKECVLDRVTKKISGAAVTQLSGTMLRDLNTKRDGKALYVQNLNLQVEMKTEIDKIVVLGLKEGNTSVMCPANRSGVVTAVAKSYVNSQKVPNAEFVCTLPKSDDVTWASIYALADPANTPVGEYYALQRQIGGNISAYAHDQLERWRWNNGFYDITDKNDDPFARKILTPGYLVSQGATQAYTAGYRCLEGADELGEMCESMFSAMIPESFSSGLSNMTRAQSGLPSYVSRMVSEASAAVRGEAVNVALSNLLNVRTFEIAFLQAKESSATLLTNAINRLRNTEKTCWQMIAYNDQGPDKHVCSAPPQGNSCTAVGGGQITIATSTQFSSAVINTQIAPLGLEVGQEAQKSAQTLKEIDELITSVSDAASTANQRAAISRLDAMLAANSRIPNCSPQKTLHVAADVQCATKQRDDISGAIGILVEDTIRAWGDSTDVNVGWCNINNPALIQKWTDAWKK